MHNILTAPIIRMTLTGGRLATASLPEVYAALMADEVDAFPALRPHQRHAWHAFLVQLGVMAMQKGDVSDAPADAEHWRRLIRGLTPGYPDDEPWRMVVDDITKPAFMQPPASSKARVVDFKSEIGAPDELDMLVTAKNHDLKASVASTAGVDDWLFGLISLQTMEGFGGAGNFGVSRMNGGFGGRAAFSVTPETRPGVHVRRDITALFDAEDTAFENAPTMPGGVRLLWLLPWDGAKAEALGLSDLDDLYIEVCRRVRLQARPGGGLYAVRATSKGARIESKDSNGITGDPWTPISVKESKALTLAVGGFTYKRVVQYLASGDWRLPALAIATAAERRRSETMQLVARAMVRGQGKTEGYYERIIPLREKMQGAMMGRAARDELGSIAHRRIERISIVQRILSHAIQVFLARGDGDKTSPEHRQLARPWLNKLDAIVDATFFDALQDELEADQSEREGIRNRWLRNKEDRTGVVYDARRILDGAIDSLPCPAIERYKARAEAERLFEGRMRGNKGLPILYDDTTSEEV